MPKINFRKLDLSKKYLFSRYLKSFPQLATIDQNSYFFVLSRITPAGIYKKLEPVNSTLNLNGFSLFAIPIEEWHKFISLNSFVLEYNDKSKSDLMKECGLDKEAFGIMGIVNVTPDSFSDGGLYNTRRLAVQKALELIHEGANIIDIGGESTRPGSEGVEAKEEINRVVPVIEELRAKNAKIKISIDTTKAIVAQKALEAGADMINDVSAFSFDPEMLTLCSESEVPLIAMHIKGTPKSMQKSPFYEDVVEDIFSYFENKIAQAQAAGFNKLILDPGIGFGKRVLDNFEIIDRCGEFKILGYPLLIGLSKKSYIGKSLNLTVDKRENATVISEMIAVQNGAEIIRTHNVKFLNEARKLISFYNDPELLKDV